MRALILTAVASSLTFQVPAQIVNGNVQLRQGPTIEREIAAAAQENAPSWIAWKVPTASGRSHGCCWYTNDGYGWMGCGIEPNYTINSTTPPPKPAGPVPLEAGTTMLVMARVAEGKVERVRTFGDDCPIDAGGRTIRMVDGVTPDASVRWLTDYASSTLAADPRSNQWNSALSAIAGTNGAAADAALDRFAEPGQPANVRRQAVHWMGQRGPAGFQKLKGMLAREATPEMRRAVIRAISQSRLPESVPTLVGIAKNDADPSNRGEALMALAQAAGSKARADITSAIENDPDTNVQVRALQALSQLPKDEGVPAMIGIARSHKNAKVRERAIRLLGESKDPRAVKFFEELLIK